MQPVDRAHHLQDFDAPSSLGELASFTTSRRAFFPTAQKSPAPRHPTVRYLASAVPNARCLDTARPLVRGEDLPFPLVCSPMTAWLAHPIRLSLSIAPRQSVSRVTENVQFHWLFLNF